ncbi:hypothetical protein V6N13_121837 [Hibiscus sabdariffa]|uniref:Uncharacterized protein n=1 Tax=Hibiscus sabdariffa TaxID=183260 RepID=A0ABR2C7Q5_9ROSI
MLSKAGGLPGSLISNKPNSSIDIESFRPKISCFQKFATTAGRGRKGIPHEMRNMFLVVLVLIITASYDASLNPPKKVENKSSSVKYQVIGSTSPTPSPPAMDIFEQDGWADLIDVSSMFWLYNTLTFWAAIGLTAYLLPSRSISLFLLMTLSLFGSCYMLLVAVFSWKLQYLFSLKTIPLSYHALSIVNYCLSTLLAVLVSSRIAGYVSCRFLPKTKMFCIVQIVSFSAIAFCILTPAILNAETILKFSDFLY